MLVIYIPTFNRVDECIRQIESIIDQKSSLPFRIVVSDNGDSLKLRSYCNVNKIEIVSHSVNKGMDFNLTYFVNLELNEDDWVWCLSDDDIVLSDALQRIVDLIGNLNTEVVALKMTHSAQNPKYNDREVSSLDEFKTTFKDFKSTDFIFYSTCLFRSDTFKFILNELESIRNTYINFSFIYLILLKYNFSIATSSLCVVRHRHSVQLSYNHVSVFNANLNVYKCLKNLFPSEYKGLITLISAVNLRSVIIFCLRTSNRGIRDMLRIKLSAVAIFLNKN